MRAKFIPQSGPCASGVIFGRRVVGVRFHRSGWGFLGCMGSTGRRARSATGAAIAGSFFISITERA